MITLHFKNFIRLIFLCVLTACSSHYNSSSLHLTSVNIIDRNGFSETISSSDRLKQYETVDFLTPMPYQKVLRVYGRDTQGNIASCITSYHPNGQPQQYLEVLNGRACGTYKEWHANGQQKIEAYVISGEADLHPGAENTWLFDGLNKIWDEEGNLVANIYYSKGYLEGTSLYYHADGTLWKKIPYSKNLLEGNLEIYLQSSQLLQIIPYSHDVKHGQAIRYWDGNGIAAAENYVEGLLESATYFHPSGEIAAEIHNGNGYRAVFGKDQLVELQEYRNGQQEGEVKAFGKRGQLVRTYFLKGGMKHGEEIEYYDHPLIKELQPKLSITWYEDLIQGVVKTWYSNGVLESQRERNRNMKHGLAMAWYQDGSLMLIEEYEKDKLVKGEYFKKGEKTAISSIMGGKGIATLYDGEGRFLRTTHYEKGNPILES